MTERRPAVVALLASLLAILPLEARAASICVADLPAKFARAVEVPVGCALVDCCPRCPLERPVDWRVRLAGEALAGASLRFRGGGRPEERTRVPVGETRLESVGDARGRGGLRSASIALQLDPDVVARWRSQARDSDAEGELGSLSVEIDQLLGAVVVSRFSLRWTVVDCELVPLPPCDRVVQNGNSDGDSSVILMDDRREPGTDGCRDDEMRRSPGTASVGNLRRPAGCRSEVGVFSSENAAAFREDVPWTDACGDTETFDLVPRLQAPAKVWNAVSNPVSLLWWGNPDAGKIVKEDVAYARQVYDQNKTGIDFTADSVTVSEADWKKILEVLPNLLVDTLLQKLDVLSTVCALPKGLEDLGFYEPGKLNVYYLPLPFTGMICADDRNVIFVGLVKKPATLAHELGHSLSLLGHWGHTRDVPGFDSHNVMWVKDTDLRDHFSLGQAFRMNLDDTSTLNTNGVRQGTTRPCPPDAQSQACPILKTDWTRP
jgi:hypothetical protein